MPFAYLLCGPSLAGKSSAAVRIAAATGAPILSADAINAERGLPFGAEGLPESAWAETLSLLIERLRAHGQAGQSVIVDDTQCYRWLRDRYRSECASCGLTPVLLVFAPPPGEVFSRRAGLARSGARPVLSPARLEDHLARFEWPGEDEPFEDLTSGEALAAFLEPPGIPAGKRA